MLADVLQDIPDMATPLHTGGLGAITARWLKAQLREQVLPRRAGHGKPEGCRDRGT